MMQYMTDYKVKGLRKRLYTYYSQNKRWYI